MSAGFCFGVVQAINRAEQLLQKEDELYSLGQMVHNEEELRRLAGCGLQIVDKEDFAGLKGKPVIVRAHGEPPETYEKAREYDIHLIDATCPIVLKLQERIAKHDPENEQVVIFGKEGHPETVGLNGQIGNRGIVVEGEKDIEKIDFQKNVMLYSQTTMDNDAFQKLEHLIRKRLAKQAALKSHNTICGQMKRRKPALIEFVKKYDVVLFVAGKNSSNGRFLYEMALKHQPATYKIRKADDICPEWLEKAERVGISGATSTPRWLLNQIAQHVKALME